MTRSAPTQPLSWRRVSALSSTFSLHILALALALLAMTAPRMPPELLREQPPPLQVDLVDPPPIEAPTPPEVELAPPPPPVLVQRVQPQPQIEASPLAEPTDVIAPIVTEPTIQAEPQPPQPVATQPRTVNQAAVAYADVRPPDYPASARTRGQEGEALVRILVGTDGRAAQVRIERSSGHSILDRAALQAVRGWRFHPARIDGIAREAWIVVPINFSLERH